MGSVGKLSNELIISSEEISSIIKNINLFFITSKENMIYCEIGQAIINYNNELISFRKLMPQADCDLNGCKYNYKNELELIKSLCNVIKGRSPAV